MRNIVLACLVVAGCAATTDKEKLYMVETTYVAAMEQLAAYKSQPPCTAERVVGCSDPARVKRLLAADDVAYAAIVSARGQNNPQAIAAARVAVNSMLGEINAPK